MQGSLEAIDEVALNEKSLRAGRYVRQAAHYSAFIPAPLPLATLAIDRFLPEGSSGAATEEGRV